MKWLSISEYKEITHGRCALVTFDENKTQSISAHYSRGIWFIDCEDGLMRTCSPLFFKPKKQKHR